MTNTPAGTFHDCKGCSTGTVVDVRIPVACYLHVDVEYTCLACDKVWVETFEKHFPSGRPHWVAASKRAVESPDAIYRGKKIYVNAIKEA